MVRCTEDSSAAAAATPSLRSVFLMKIAPSPSETPPAARRPSPARARSLTPQEGRNEGRRPCVRPPARLSVRSAALPLLPSVRRHTAQQLSRERLRVESGGWSAAAERLDGLDSIRRGARGGCRQAGRQAGSQVDGDRWILHPAREAGRRRRRRMILQLE